MSDPTTEKAVLRTRLRALRRQAAAADPGAAEALARLFLIHVGLRPGAIVAGYRALGGEIDPAPLLAALAGRGHPLALPCTGAAGTPLMFRRFRLGDPLVRGGLGIEEPAPTAAPLTPAVALVPLIGFDRRGHRLGQGGGYYDRTLADSAILAVGLAYAAQEVELVPAESWDRRLDWIVTEREAIHP